MIRTECDICRKKYRFENDFSGSVVRCRECRAEFEVPVRSLWEKFSEANPELAEATKWAAQGAVAVLLLVGLTVGGFELSAAMNEESGPAETTTSARPTTTTPAVPRARTPPPNPGVSVSPVPDQVPNVTPPTPPRTVATPSIPSPAPTPATASSSLSQEMQDLKQRVAEYPIAITSTTELPGNPARMRLTGRGFSKATALRLLFSGNREFRPEYTIVDDATMDVTLSIGNGARNVMFGIETADGLAVTVAEYAREITSSRGRPGFYHASTDAKLAVPLPLAHVLILPDGKVQAHSGAGGNVFLVLAGGTLLPPADDGKPITIIRSEKADAPPPSGHYGELYLSYPAIFPCPVPELYSDMFLLLLRERRQ